MTENEIKTYGEYEVHPGSDENPGWHVVHNGQSIGSYGTLEEARGIAREIAAQAAEREAVEPGSLTEGMDLGEYWNPRD